MDRYINRYLPMFIGVTMGALFVNLIANKSTSTKEDPISYLNSKINKQASKFCSQRGKGLGDFMVGPNNKIMHTCESDSDRWFLIE